MSKLDSNRGRAAGIDANDRTRTGNDREIPARYNLSSREIPVTPTDCHIDPQVMEIDIFDLSAVRRETGALSARLFAAVDDVSLALAGNFTPPGVDDSGFEEMRVYCEPTRETDTRAIALKWSNTGPDNRSQHCPPATGVDPFKELQRLRLKLATQLETVAASGRLINDATRGITNGIKKASIKMDQLNSKIRQLVPDD